MYKKQFIVFVLLSSMWSHVMAQGGTDNNTTNELRRDIIPHSPEAEAFSKFVTTPVTLHQGTPSVSIPIFDIKSSKLSMSISLAHNYNGYRPGEQASCVGLGWSLAAGGCITRIVKGLVDNTSSYDNYDDYVDISALMPRQQVLEKSANGLSDTEPDLYIFNFNGFSGKFILLKGRAVMFPYQDLAIKKEGSGESESFEIIVQDGTRYIFDAREITSHTNNNQSVPAIPGHNSAWFLTKVESADKTDVIDLSYYNYTYLQRPAISESYTVNTTEGAITPGTTGHAYTPYVYQGAGISSKVLARIEGKNVIINFDTTTAAREDLASLYNRNPKALQDIRIYNKPDNMLIKKFTLTHGYFESGNSLHPYSKLKLKEVQIKGLLGNPATEQIVSKYVMDYENENAASYATETNGIDIYGYANGANSNPSLYPNDFIIPSLTNRTGNRQPNYDYCKNGLLTKITYPTGGSSVFEYEKNEYLEDNPIGIPHWVEQTQPFNTAFGDPSVSPPSESFTIETSQVVKIYYGREYNTATHEYGVRDDSRILSLYVFPQYTQSTASLLYQTPALIAMMKTDDSATVMLGPGTYSYTITCENISTRTYGYLLYHTTSLWRNVPYGGMRIHAIKSYDNINNSAPVLTKTFEYNNALGQSTLQKISGMYIDSKTVDHIGGCQSTMHTTVYSVTDNSAFTGLLDNQYYYNKVSEINYDVSKGGKSTYEFGGGNGDAMDVILLKQTDNKYSGGSFIPLSSTQNFYAFTTKDSYTAFKAVLTQAKDMPVPDGCIDATYLTNPDNLDNRLITKIYHEQSYGLGSAARQLTSTVEISYDQDGFNPSISETDVLYENPLYLFPTRKIQKNSKGEEVITKFKYPYDYSFSSCGDIGTVGLTFSSDKNAVKMSYNGGTTGCILQLENALTSYQPFQLQNSTNQGNFTTIVNSYHCESTYKSQSQTAYSDRNTSFSTLSGCLSTAIASNSNESEKSILLMQKNHILSPVIEQYSILKKGSVEYLMAANKTNYRIQATTASYDVPVIDNITQTEFKEPLLLSTFTANANNYYKSQIVFTEDNKINLTEQHKLNDISNSYVWDYQDMYPIAEVINAVPQDIAHTSFETAGGGGFTIPFSLGVEETSAPTGKKVCLFDESTFTITKQINSAKTYVVSLWATAANHVLVNGISPVRTGKTINGWTYYEWQMAESSLFTLSASGYVKIDELRLYPTESQMNTFTYTPVIGITSKCDVNNIITTYEYDNMGRLIRILDQDKNILKMIDYKYLEVQ